MENDPTQILANVQKMMAAGRLPEAEAALRRLLPISPANAALQNQIGLLCHRQRKFAEAEVLFRSAIAIDSSSAPFHLNLGETVRLQGRLADAIACFSNAIALSPEYAMAYFNLGVALRQVDRLDEAIAAYREAVRIKPDEARAWNNLASTLRAQGRIAEALVCFRRCLEIAPTAEAHSNLLYAMWFDPACAPIDIATEHARWDERWGKPFANEIRPFTNPRDPNRRLRIGYVSPDFRQHVIALFMQPILQHRNRRLFNVYCYSDIANADFMTDRIRADTDEWIPTNGMSDADLAERIRKDRIDILVDLTAHMARNRLVTFARKPAPVQVSYLAYAGTTGLSAMDYRLNDVYLDPIVSNEAKAELLGPEEVISLPETYWCYKPQTLLPEVRPRTPNRPMTFACYNACSKINPRVIGVWAEILRARPGSLLRVIIGGGERGNDHLKRGFVEEGIDRERIELQERVNFDAYFPLYEDADIALDPFPYNGGTTTLDALYMGVPVITLAGSSGMSRAGVSILTNLGLPELIAYSSNEYVRIAVDLANNGLKLAALRNNLRARMAGSPLMNVPRFVGNLENAYRDMWQNYCAKG